MGGHQYTISTWGERIVSEYTGLNFLQLEEVSYLRYLQWRRDAYIYRLNQTEEGREYLDNAWRMEQSKPDRIALRKKLKEERRVDGKQ